LLGGTFDPPHLGHLVAAEAARDRLGLDEVRLVVANQPWQKEGSRPITDAWRRLELVRAAVHGAGGLTACDLEIRLGGPSYLSITLDHLHRDEPGTDFYALVGADTAVGLDTWHRSDRLRRQARFVVLARPGVGDGPPAGWPHERLDVPSIGVSSSMVRDLVAQGRSIRFLCPERVVARIQRWGLYGPAL
jgi:nicotinate-nucleotide adenylyltransferase